MVTCFLCVTISRLLANNEWTAEFRDLIKNILQKDPTKRLTIPQILAHAWFTNHAPHSRDSLTLGTTTVSTQPTSTESPSATSGNDASASSVTSESTHTSSEFEASSATSPDEDEHEALHLHRNPSQTTIKKLEGGNPRKPSTANKKQQPETVKEEESTPQPIQQAFARLTGNDGGPGPSETPSRPPSQTRFPPPRSNSTNSKEPPLPTRTPVRTKRRSVSSQLSDHENDPTDPGHDSPSLPQPEKFNQAPLPLQDYASLLQTPAPIIFGTPLERDLLNVLSAMGFDTAQIVHSVLTDACDATGAMWWILKRKAEKKVVEEGGLNLLAQSESDKHLRKHSEKKSSRKEEAMRRGSVDKIKKKSDHGQGHRGEGTAEGEGDETPHVAARIPALVSAHSAPELAFIPPTPTAAAHQQASTPPRPRSPNNPFLTPTIVPAVPSGVDSLGKSHHSHHASHPSTPAGSLKDKDGKEFKDGSKGRREGKARSGSVSIMQRATTALEAAGLVRKKSSETVSKEKDDKGKGKEEDKRPTTAGEDSRSSHGSGSRLTKSPPLWPVKDSAIPQTPGNVEASPPSQVMGSPWVMAGATASLSSTDADLPGNSSPGDTLTALPDISKSGMKTSGHHRNRASLLSAFRMWFNEDRKGKRKAGLGSATHGMAYGHAPRTPSAADHRGTVKMKRRTSGGSTRNGHRAKGPSISSHRSSSVNSRRSSTASMHMVVLESPSYGFEHITRQRSDPSRRSFGTHTPNSERGEYFASSRPSSVQSFSVKPRHRKSPSASSAGSVQYLSRAASPYHRRGGSGSSTRVIRSPPQNLSRPAHARTNSATSSVYSSSRPGSFYEQSESESAMRTASPFRHGRRSYDDSTPRRSTHSHGSTTFVAQKRQTPFMPPAMSYSSSSGGSVGRTSWKKSWGLEPPGWQSRQASLPIEVLAISPAGEGSTNIRDVFTSRSSLSATGRPGSGGAGGATLIDDDSDWVDEDDDIPAFVGGLGQVSSLASGMPATGLGGGASPMEQTFGSYSMEAPVMLSPAPSRIPTAMSRNTAGKRGGKNSNGGAGGSGVVASSSRKAGHSPMGRVSPSGEDSLRHDISEARGGRRGQLPKPGFRTTAIQEEDEGEEEEE